MIVTIHQPDFMPWLGFFKKIAAADIWIVLDHVYSNPRDAASWLRRVKILANRSPFWFSLPIKKPKSGSLQVRINELEYDWSQSKLLANRLKTIEQSYKKSKNYDRIFPLIKKFFDDNDKNVAKKNIKFIKEVNKLLDIKTDIRFSSEFDISSKSTQLLIDLVKIVGGETYLSGDGASEYLKDSMFPQNNICLKFNQFSPLIYNQLSKNVFYPRLSVVDALFNVEIDEIKNHILVLLLSNIINRVFYF